MAAFDGFPVEIIQAIARNLPSTSLASFSRVSRTVNAATVPVLYHTVRYIDNDEATMDATTELRSLDAEIRLERSSRIFNLSAFVQTLATNRDLRFMVTSVDLFHEHDRKGQSMDVRQSAYRAEVICLLYLVCPSLKELHWTECPHYFPLPVMNALIRLELHLDYVTDHYEWSGVVSPFSKSLAVFPTLSSVRSVVIHKAELEILIF